MTTRNERHHLPYVPEQMFDLVADVESYPDFVPWLLAAHIRERHGDTLLVEMTVGTTLLRRRFGSTAQLERPHRISIMSHDALFERFAQVWTFEAADDGGTNVTYHVDFQFRSRLLQAIMGARFADMAGTMLSAFRRRARSIYGAN
jgi:coenzyme Q-binding protein COQ10